MVFPGVSVIIGLAAEELVSMLSADEDAAKAARVSAVLVSACLAMDFVGIGLELLVPEYVNVAGPFQEVCLICIKVLSHMLEHVLEAACPVICERRNADCQKRSHLSGPVHLFHHTVPEVFDLWLSLREILYLSLRSFATELGRYALK